MVGLKLRFFGQRLLHRHLIEAAQSIHPASFTDLLVQYWRQSVILAFTANLLQLGQLIATLNQETYFIAHCLYVVRLWLFHKVEQQILVVRGVKSLSKQERVE